NFDFGDINNDSHKDLLWTSSKNIFYYKSINGTGDVEEPQYVSRYLVAPKGVFADDLNGDGFNDYITHSGNKLLWYSNLDGEGNFGYENLVDENLQNLQDVYTEDIDGDNDIDIIAASQNTISYYENVDGQGNFGLPIIISAAVSNAAGVVADDLDGDGDMDVVSVSTLDDRVAWYENLDGQGAFGPQNIISTLTNNPIIPILVDVDNDGDKDLIVVDSSRVSIFINTDGLGNFGPRQIIAYGLSSPDSLFSEDLDNDGDMDLVFNNYNESLYFYENSDGLGNFILKTVLISDSHAAGSTFGADIDGDNDIDILTVKDTEIAWFENLDGQGTFQEDAANIIITELFTPNYIFAKDINGDGTIDILSSIGQNNKISWYSNLGLLGNRIDGSIRIDLNGNGCDQTDLPMPNIMVKTTNGANTFATFTQSSGYYFINTNEGDFTTSIESVLPTYYTSTPAFHDSNFIGFGNFDTANFCVSPDGTVNDLNIAMYPLTGARPGFD